MTIQVHSLDQLDEAAEKLIAEFKYPVVLFEGELGAGKTTLIKSLVKKMGSKDEVSSPTFSIINEYDCPTGKIYHFDFYRIKSEEEALDFGTDEYLDSGYPCFIEWPDRISGLLPEGFHRVKIISEEGIRNIFFD